MGFDAERFDRAEMAPRTKRVPVPALAAWFAEGEPAEWEVRGLTATELHRAIEAGKRQGSVDAIVKAIAANADQTQAVRRALGLTSDTPGEIAKRIELLVLGSVVPKVEMPTAVRLAERFPIEFMQLTNEVGELTGMGFDLVKPPAASQPIPA